MSVIHICHVYLGFSCYIRYFLIFNSSLAYLYFSFLIVTVSGFCFHLNAQGVMQQNSSL